MSYLGVLFWLTAATTQVPTASQYGPPAHAVTMEEWRRAVVEYKLVAAGEWAYAVLGPAWLSRNGHESLGRKAAEIVLCLDNSSVGIAADDVERVADLAVVCMTLMGWRPSP